MMAVGNSFACCHILARIPWGSPRVAHSPRFIEPDQRDLPCPVLFAKIFRFSLYPNQIYIPHRPVPQRGGSRSSRTRGGMRWTRAVLQTRALTCGRRRRVVLTPRRWCQVLEKQASWGRRWQESPVAGESAQEAVKTIARGMLGEFRCDLTNACAFYHYHCTRGYRAHRAPGIPCALFGRNDHAQLGRLAPRERRHMLETTYRDAANWVAYNMKLGCVLQRRRPSKTKVGDKIAALFPVQEGAFDPLQRFLGVFITECCGTPVIGFGGGRIFRPAAPFLGECAHPLQRGGMTLRRRLLEQGARAGIILGAAGTLRQHQTKLILRLRTGLGGLCQELPRPRRIRRRAAAAERSKIADAARIAGLRGALEQFSRQRFIPRNARAGAIEHTEPDHGRARALVGRLAPCGDRFRQLVIGGVGAAQLIERAPRGAGGNFTEFARGRDIGRSEERR